MKVEIKSVPTLRLFCMRVVGPYSLIGDRFPILAQKVEEEQIPAQGWLAPFYDDPSTTPAEQLRSDVAVLVPLDWDGNVGSNPEPVDGEFHIKAFPATDYVVGTHIGPYEHLPAAWQEFMSEIPRFQRKLSPIGCFEMYMNHPGMVPPEELWTDLYFAVEAAG